MNKSEFIRAYADKLGITIKEADANFNAFVDTITDSLKKGEYIQELNQSDLIFVYLYLVLD